MRHGKKFNHLSRRTGHRKALLTNQAKSLLEHKRIFTTVAKAKALRQFIEPIITKAKQDSTHARRIVFSYFQDKEPVKILFNEVAPKVGDRPGGYTRIIKMENRLGDNAETCMIELVDYNDTYQAKEATSKQTKSKTRRGKSKPKAEVETTAATNDIATSSPVEQQAASPQETTEVTEPKTGSEEVPTEEK
jgi:large subunit ribosomal protein L17